MNIDSFFIIISQTAGCYSTVQITTQLLHLAHCCQLLSFYKTVLLQTWWKRAKDLEVTFSCSIIYRGSPQRTTSAGLLWQSFYTPIKWSCSSGWNWTSDLECVIQYIIFKAEVKGEYLLPDKLLTYLKLSSKTMSSSSAKLYLRLNES